MASHFIRGAEKIDVPALGMGDKRDYKLNFIGYKEGTTSAQVRFVNEQTMEYVLYNVEVEVTEPETIDTIYLEAPVRQTVQSVVVIENPLPATTPVTFGDDWWKCENPCIRIRPLGEMSGSQEGAFEVEYRPLVPIELEETALTITCEELGDYRFKLKLKALPAALAGTLRFNTALGSSQTQTIRFQNYVGAATQYKLSVDQPEFFTLETETIDADAAEKWTGAEVATKITFEPSAVGKVSDRLVITSDAGGEYVYKLVGHCAGPRPTGPVLIEKDAVVSEVLDVRARTRRGEGGRNSFLFSLFLSLSLSIFPPPTTSPGNPHVQERVRR